MSPSTVSTSTPTTTTNVLPSAQVKTKTPDMYYGDRRKLDEWLLQLDLYFKFQGQMVAAQQRVLFASTFMRGQAQRWIKPHIEKYFSHLASKNDSGYQMAPDVEKSRDLIEVLHQFRLEIRKVFGITDQPATANRIIQSLKQTKSVSEYAATFTQFMAISDWNDDAVFRNFFRKGLRDNVKDELIRQDDDDISTLDELITVSIKIDDKLRQRAYEKKGSSGYTRPTYGTYGNNYRSNEQRPRGPPKTHEQAQGQGYYGSMPMEIDTITKKQHDGNHRRGRGGYQPSKRSSCYSCGKPGHKAANCRSRNTNKVRRHINVIATSDHDGSDREEWDVVETRQEIDERLSQRAIHENIHQETLDWLTDVEGYGNLTLDQIDQLDFPELEKTYRMDHEQEPTEYEGSDFELDAPNTQQIIHEHYRQLRQPN